MTDINGIESTDDAAERRRKQAFYIVGGATICSAVAIGIALALHPSRAAALIYGCILMIEGLATLGLWLVYSNLHSDNISRRIRAALKEQA